METVVSDFAALVKAHLFWRRGARLGRVCRRNEVEDGYLVDCGEALEEEEEDREPPFAQYALN